MRLAGVVSLLGLACGCLTPVAHGHTVTIETDPPGAVVFSDSDQDAKEPLGLSPQTLQFNYTVDRWDFSPWWWSAPLALGGAGAAGLTSNVPELEGAGTWLVITAGIGAVICTVGQIQQGKGWSPRFPRPTVYSAVAPGRLEQREKVVFGDRDVALVFRLPVDPRGPEVAAAADRPASALPSWATARGIVKRIAVLEFHGGALEEGALTALADEARSVALESTRGRGYAVMTRESMAAMLKDMGRPADCAEGECEVETARNLGADLVITGEIVQLAGTYVVTLKLHETSRGTLLSAGRAKGKDSLELLDALGPAAVKLFE